MTQWPPPPGVDALQHVSILRRWAGGIPALAGSLMLLAASCGPAEAPSTEAVTLVSAGWQLAGTFTRAPGPQPRPAVLLLHRAAGTRQEYARLVEELGQRGISSLALDLRGHGESTNLGRFMEPYADHLHINADAQEDVVAALEWLAARGDVDGRALAVVGASYSGELAGRALREGTRAAAYVMISPGNFSDESIAAAAESDAEWLFVRSVEESPVALPYIDTLFQALEERAPALGRRVLQGAGHATHLLEGRPELAVELADWIEAALTS